MAIVRIPDVGEMPQGGNLRGYWPLEQNRNDTSGGGSNLVDGSAFQQSMVANSVRGAWLGAPSSAIDYRDNSPSANLLINGDLTVMFALKLGARPEAPTSGPALSLFELSDGSGTSATVRYGLEWLDDDQMRVSFSNGAGAVEQLVITDMRLAADASHVFTLRRSGTAVDLFADGIQIGATTLTAALGNGTGGVLVLGRDISTSQRAAVLGGLGIWDLALTTQEVVDTSNLYLSPQPVTTVDPGNDVFDADFQATPGRYQRVSTGVNYNVTFINPVAGRTLLLDIDNTGGAQTLTLPGSVVSTTGSFTGGARNFVYVQCVDDQVPEFVATIR